MLSFPWLLRTCNEERPGGFRLDFLSSIRVLTRQATFAEKIDKIDFWGKTLTIILVVYGLILGAWMLYQMWEQSTRVAN
jgi:hypothetical protein